MTQTLARLAFAFANYPFYKPRIISGAEHHCRVINILSLSLSSLLSLLLLLLLLLLFNMMTLFHILFTGPCWVHLNSVQWEVPTN